jgi:hypothetical protein
VTLYHLFIMQAFLLFILILNPLTMLMTQSITQTTTVITGFLLMAIHNGFTTPVKIVLLYLLIFKAMARVVGYVVMRLANAPVIPLNLSFYASAISKSVASIQNMTKIVSFDLLQNSTNK